MRVVYRKYGGKLHWNHDARRLGEDEHGIWVGLPKHSTMQRGDEPPVVFKVASVLLFPRNSWWTAAFNDAPHDTEIYCDITTVPEWREGEVTMVDLDLDVIRKRDGRLILDDEDEFAEHQVQLGYPAEVIKHAEEAARWLMDAVGGRKGPFGGAHERWLGMVS